MGKKSDKTVEFDPARVLAEMRRHEAATQPIDVDEVKRAAAESTRVPDPHPRRARPRETPAVVRRDNPTLAFRAVHKPPEPFVEIAIIGDADIYALPIRQLTATGIAVSVAVEQAPLLQAGVDVLVDIALDDADERIELRLPARVAHRRAARPGVEGGALLQWLAVDDAVAERVARLASAWARRAP